MSKKTILVTGGSGFIASHLVDRLVDLDYFVINLDKLDYCSYNNTLDIDGKYKFIQGNLNNLELLRHLFKIYEIDTVFHLAAQTHVDNSFYNSLSFTYDNISGTHTLLEVCREYGKLQRFIHMSTDEVYGEVKMSDKIKTEESLLMPTNPYAATKAGAEMLVNAYYMSFKLPVIIIRCNNVYGPRQYPEKVIPAFIYNLLNNNKCSIHGDGNNERHFLYVSDAIEAFMTIWNKGEINNIYNIASQDTSIKIIKLAKLLIRKLKDKPDNTDNYIEHVEDRKFNDLRYYISSDKLNNMGWVPRVKFTEGLNLTIEYFKSKVLENKN